MKGRAFIDTNVFIYLYSQDEPTKRKCVYQAFENYECVTSVQVLNEFSNVCIKKMGMSVDLVKKAVEEIKNNIPIMPIDVKTVFIALDLHKKYGYSYYDCLILSSSLYSESKYLLSEDMSDGQIIQDQLTIVNIFNR